MHGQLLKLQSQCTGFVHSIGMGSFSLSRFYHVINFFPGVTAFLISFGLPVPDGIYGFPCHISRASHFHIFSLCLMFGTKFSLSFYDYYRYFPYKAYSSFFLLLTAWF